MTISFTMRWCLLLFVLITANALYIPKTTRQLSTCRGTIRNSAIIRTNVNRETEVNVQHPTIPPETLKKPPINITKAIILAIAIFGNIFGKNILPAVASNELSRIQVQTQTVHEVEKSWNQLTSSLQGAKLDSLIMLIATSVVIPLFKRLKTSPIIGFLLTGAIIGPNGFNFIHDVHTIDVFGELGIVFFLFEMGLELSFERLKAMRKDVFGLGTSQFLLTTIVGAFLAKTIGRLSIPAAITIGGSLALSSSAFVLQILKDKNAMGTRHGKASFGILLLQDLAVVPLIVIVQLLAKGGSGLGKALTIAGIKAVVTLSTMSLLGKKLLNPIFSKVAKSNSHEAFLSIILTTVLLMSYVTKGIGLSDTLGAFLAGILLSETSYRYQVESDIAPFRGLLLGLFFITVGFSINFRVLWTENIRIGLLLLSLLGGKAAIITILSLLFRIPLSSAIQCGLLNSQGGEFAFVALGIAERGGLIDSSLCKLLLTTVAMSMAVTPFLADFATTVAKYVERRFSVSEQKEIAQVQAECTSSDFVVVAGYGKVGKMICEILDKKLIKYVVIDNNPQKVADAKKQGLPVYFGDITRPDVLKHFNIGSAKACVLTIEDTSITNLSVVRLRKQYQSVPIVARSKDVQHKQRLMNFFDNVTAVTPAVTEDSLLLSLPFSVAVMEQIGVSPPEVEAILDELRSTCFEDKTTVHGGFFSGIFTQKPVDVVAKVDQEQEKTTIPITIPSTPQDATTETGPAAAAATC